MGAIWAFIMAVSAFIGYRNDEMNENMAAWARARLGARVTAGYYKKMHLCMALVSLIVMLVFIISYVV